MFRNAWSPWDQGEEHKGQQPNRWMKSKKFCSNFFLYSKICLGNFFHCKGTMRLGISNGYGPKNLAQVGSCHLWFWFNGHGKIPTDKKIALGQVKKYPSQRRVDLLFIAGQKYARVGSGQGSTLVSR